MAVTYTFYRNHASSDTTESGGSFSQFSGVFPDITHFNWTSPDNTSFKEWNLNRDGSSTVYHPGDALPQTGDGGTYYAIWQESRPAISKIVLPSGSTYYFKDEKAREDIEAIESAIAGGVTFMGETTTVLTDGSTVSTIVINGSSVSAIKGYLVVYQSVEFIFDGTKWIELGDLSLIGDLGWKDSASAEYTPAGSVSKPTFTGLVSNISFRIEDATSGNYQPRGTVSKPTFTGSTSTFSKSFKPSGTVNFGSSGKTATVSVGSGDATYTPEGSVSTPIISVKTAGSTTTFNSLTDVGSLPELTATVADETLTLAWNAGTLPTKGENVTVRTGDAELQSSTPTFTGTGVRLTTANIPVPTSAVFTGDTNLLSVSGTPNGTVSTPSFTGGKVRISGTTTPAGNVSQPSFSGTKATITVT